MTPTKRRTFATNGFGVTAQSLGKPTAIYPGAVATDSDMIIAVNRQQTRLAVPLNTTDTSMTVVDPSVIAPYCLLTIDAETVKTTGPATGNVVPITRGFDGTTAAVHLAGAVVSGFIDAYHHNRLVAEVEAIQQTLGANLSRIPAVSQIVSTAFDFPAQTPGGNLVAGNNSITLSPVPLGVNGTDTGHYLYVSGGTGAAEPVLITGGTAVAGAPSGTLIITCANTHSGAWTIRSATAGIQEAVNSLPGGSGSVVVPSGTWTLYGPITVSNSGVTIQGVGVYATTLTTGYTGGPLISFRNSGYNRLIGMRILGVGSGSNYAVLLDGQLAFSMDDVEIDQVGGGIQIIGASTFRVLLDNVNVSYFTGTGISIEGGADHFLSRLNIHGHSVATTIGIRLSQSGGTWIWDGDIIACNVGLQMDPLAGSISWVWLTDTAFDTPLSTGIFINPSAGAAVHGINLVNCWTASSSGSGGIGIAGTGMFIGSTGNVDGIRIIGHRFVGNNTNGLVLFGGAHILMDSCLFAGNGAAGASGLFVAGGVSSWTVRNSQIGQSDGFPNSQTYGINISPGASDNFVIENNSFLANVTAPIFNGATGTHNVIRNNQGYNPVGQSAITVGASPFAYTAGASREIVYIYGGTVSNIKVGSTQVASASPAQINLYPNESLTVTYTVAPTMVKDVQ